MIEVSCLKNENAAELFLGLRIGAIGLVGKNSINRSASARRLIEPCRGTNDKEM
jgi:hypothetical protein